jgi:predicted permease
MISSFYTIAPIFFVIAVGFFSYRFKFINDSAIKINNALVFYIFLPALLVNKIAHSNIKSMFDINMVLVLYLSVFLVFILSAATSRILNIKDEQKGAVYISSFRGNFAYMGLPVAYYLFSDKGIVIGSMLIAFIVPFVNILSIFSLSISNEKNYKKVLKDSIFTPIVIASVIGIFLSVYDVEVPLMAERFLNILSQPALTLALIGIGASLKFSQIAKKPKEIMLSVVLKLAVLPFIGVFLLKIMPIENISAKVLLIMLAAPPATLNYIMAQQMGADEVLAGANICIATIFSFFSYLFWIYYMKSFL